MGERSDETVGHMVTRQHFTVSDSHALLTQHVVEPCSVAKHTLMQMVDMSFMLFKTFTK
jgi:hypothetical protein